MLYKCSLNHRMPKHFLQHVHVMFIRIRFRERTKGDLSSSLTPKILFVKTGRGLMQPDLGHAS